MECCWDESTGMHLITDPRDVQGLRECLSRLSRQQEQHPTFPGPNPVSIDTSDFPKFKEQPYMISHKTDGTRYCMMVTIYRELKVVILFNRKLDPYIFKIQRCPNALFQGTIFDGELVGDTYLIFDTVTCCGIPVYNSPFQLRLEVAKKSLQFYDYTNTDTATITVKPFFSTKLEFSQHRSQFPSDGIVFMPCLDPVGIGRHDYMFKLKTHHTVDFLVKSGKLYVFDEKARRNKHVGMPTGPNAHLAKEGVIVECCLDPTSDPKKKEKWIVERVRADKKTSNNLYTFKKTLLNIDEALTLDKIPLN